MSGRNRGRDEAFNSDPGSGRMAYRHEWERPDERPSVVYSEPIWQSESERLTYENAVEASPRKPGEGAFAYIARLSAVVTERIAQAVQPMPRAMSRRERDARLMELREQAREAQPELVE